MADNLNKEEEDLLQSALSDAFAPAPITKVTSQPPAQPEPAALDPPAPTSEGSADASAPAGEDWRTEYDEHLAQWRARSAEQRQKAEAERAKWEAIRAQKEKEGVDWKDNVLEERRKSLKLSESSSSVDVHVPSSAASVSEWESVRAPTEGRSSPSPADSRDLVSGEKSRTAAQGPASVGSSPPVPSNTNSRPGSEPDSSKHEKWEEIPSEMTSSFPSMTMPSDPHSPSSSHQHQHADRHHHGHGHHDHRSHHHREQEVITASTAIFDSGLSTKTRVLAVLSSLAINLFLPFVNGVMLGFGEIFAKNVVVGWLGWKVPGGSITNVGIRGSRSPAQDAKRRTGAL